mmetsp:Transcript_73704/g.134802  ORF Transcript_73704/g.134802 Transcript_73704/m.134802 type:complete len:169 (+) Transcript_73704:99-605(+)
MRCAAEPWRLGEGARDNALSATGRAPRPCAASVLDGCAHQLLELHAKNHAPPRRPALKGVTKGRFPAVGGPPAALPTRLESVAAAAMRSAAAPAASAAAPLLIGDGATTCPEVVRTGTGIISSPAAGCRLSGMPNVAAFWRMTVPGESACIPAAVVPKQTGAGSALIA